MAWPEAPDPIADADGAPAAVMTDPIRDLESLSSLLFDADARATAAASGLFTPEKWREVEAITQEADRLQVATGWEDEELLRRLGCRVRTFDDFGSFGLERLENCRTFLSLVNELTDIVGPLFQQREVVSVCVDLLEDHTALSAQDLLELTMAEVDGWSAYRYVSLGEISRAARLVRSLANARRSPEPTPVPHPSPRPRPSTSARRGSTCT